MGFSLVETGIYGVHDTGAHLLRPNFRTARQNKIVWRKLEVSLWMFVRIMPTYHESQTNTQRLFCTVHFSNIAFQIILTLCGFIAIWKSDQKTWSLTTVRMHMCSRSMFLNWPALCEHDTVLQTQEKVTPNLPGFIEYAVTPVPCKMRCNLLVNKLLQNFECT